MNEMVRVTAREFGREVGRYQDLALIQPVSSLKTVAIARS
jgi:hypothetical protein